MIIYKVIVMGKLMISKKKKKKNKKKINYPSQKKTTLVKKKELYILTQSNFWQKNIKISKKSKVEKETFVDGNEY